MSATLTLMQCGQVRYQGTVNPPEGDSQIDIVFPIPAYDTGYEVSITANFSAAFDIADKATTGFTLLFSNQAPANAGMLLRVRT